MRGDDDGDRAVIELAEIEAARVRIAGAAVRTPQPVRMPVIQGDGRFLNFGASLACAKRNVSVQKRTFSLDHAVDLAISR
jgi:hypothetical protein